ncbi:hypothetical protein BCV71DRAFT_277650 [Rhizopus microsporus]|uniref:Tc1-like transposase DDE domain-containing protein n=1 Tax=Rhizopus microsporus TaxID=58291 RepID=A0A1X0RNQ1_RHIZD|nr:hypothetical protein BCV71DRAFT_277650 [Rhizopus microsporus]
MVMGKKKGELSQLIKSRGHKCIYLSLYSPELNPIEQLWTLFFASQSIFLWSAKDLSFPIFLAKSMLIKSTVTFCTWQHILRSTLSPISEESSCRFETVDSFETESPLNK